MKLSVVIPCWNDAEALDGTLRSIAALRGVHETIVADASDTAECRNVAEARGARIVRCEAPSRGGQMNAGAAVAEGDLLLFHHADTALAQDHVDALLRLERSPEVVGGAFHRRFDARHPSMRWLERIARFLAEHGGTLYGDQSLFARRTHFERMGGFADIPLMEDVEFSGRLRRSGTVEVLDPPISSSARRFGERGAWRTTLQNGATILLYRCGVSPRRLHAWYYGKRPSRRGEKALHVQGRHA